MESFSGARAVVTGGASGIGLGLATALLEDGAAQVVLADIEPEALSAAVATLAARGFGDVEAAVCDVTDPASVEALAAGTWTRLGGVEVVCLNAGVFAGGYSWEATLDDWDWVMGVNLRGMVNGVRSFLPRMIEANVPSHVIGTASIAGIVSSPASAVYCTSKFAAVGLMESLQHDLALAGAPHVATSVICPGMVNTNIDHGDRNRPARLANATKTDASNLAQLGIEDTFRQPGCLDPFVAARHALEQAKTGRFYVTTHEGDMWARLVGNQNDDRLAGRRPRFQMYE
jgi:NAD(P)-dependent dehydrogenase (short-subunit alcohol dehydrogenase family)